MQETKQEPSLAETVLAVHAIYRNHLRQRDASWTQRRKAPKGSTVLRPAPDDTTHRDTWRVIKPLMRRRKNAACKGKLAAEPTAAKGKGKARTLCLVDPYDCDLVVTEDLSTALPFRRHPPPPKKTQDEVRRRCKSAYRATTRLDAQAEECRDSPTFMDTLNSIRTTAGDCLLAGATRCDIELMGQGLALDAYTHNLMLRTARPEISGNEPTSSRVASHCWVDGQQQQQVLVSAGWHVLCGAAAEESVVALTVGHSNEHYAGGPLSPSWRLSMALMYMESMPVVTRFLDHNEAHVQECRLLHDVLDHWVTRPEAWTSIGNEDLTDSLSVRNIALNLTACLNRPNMTGYINSDLVTHNKSGPVRVSVYAYTRRMMTIIKAAAAAMQFHPDKQGWDEHQEAMVLGLLIIGLVNANPHLYHISAPVTSDCVDYFAQVMHRSAAKLSTGGPIPLTHLS
ncbi:hypothetical protein ml_72 [Mollivirus sibericum]|uniref:hypothetical protein n=1 Tax=Mollivirus sibericum TaxID=1678078 RepID=UPI0006B2E5C8|nr:hypothetical protein ml_72 [Mollivirus sibericum]ALD61874.1 hypothetical protein ml_72 [Mollivirus sibericum]